MSEHESDGVQEALSGTLRVALTAAGQMAERAARAREQAAHDAAAASAQQAREMQAQVDAQRGAARATLAPVHRDDWWDTARPQDIADAWQTAQTWRGVDPDAARAGDRIGQEVRSRWGVDVDGLGGDARVRDVLTEQQGRGSGTAQSAAERARGDAALDDIEGARLLTDADRGDAAERARRAERGDPDLPVAGRGAEGGDAEHASGALYDSAERRRDLAAALEGEVDSETIEAVVVADTNQAAPAHEAVATAPGQGPRARPARGASVRGKVAQRGR